MKKYHHSVEISAARIDTWRNFSEFWRFPRFFSFSNFFFLPKLEFPMKKTVAWIYIGIFFPFWRLFWLKAGILNNLSLHRCHYAFTLFSMGRFKMKHPIVLGTNLVEQWSILASTWTVEIGKITQAIPYRYFKAERYYVQFKQFERR